MASGFYAFCMMPSKVSLGIPLVFAIVGGIEATMAGSIVGLVIGAVYKAGMLPTESPQDSGSNLAGYLAMNTWIPLVWSVINVLVLVLSSFSLQGGL
jgi:hypothetical protein